MKKLFALLFGLTVVMSACNDGCNNGDDDNDKYLTFDFESVPATSLAGPTSFGDNLYGPSSWAPYDPSEFENGDDFPLFTSYHDAETDLVIGMHHADGFAAGGVAISQWHDMNTAGYLNQCSVYGSGGHGGSKTFGVVYASVSNGTLPSVSFKTTTAEYGIESIWVANSTYLYKEVAAENSTLRTDKGYFVLTIKGVSATGATTGKVDVPLADFRESAASPGVISEWTKVDLTSLGKVRKLEFSFDGSDKDPEWGLNTPAYVCIDDIKVKIK